jgi:hypothetical protein
VVYKRVHWIGVSLVGLFLTPVAALIAQPKTVTCSSKEGERQSCPADTSAGVALQRSGGPGECLLGKTWGYDGQSVWVSDGCSGEFVLGQAVPAPAPATASAPQPNGDERIETWGSIEPGKGFVVGRTAIGELSISAYALTRYLNQLPAHQTFIDHLGVAHNIDTRDDIYSHRIMLFFKGWIGRPKLIYTIILWTVNTTDQRAIFAVTGYQFSKKFSLYGGLNGLPGTRSLVGSHPYWLAHDRVMADEFFRPFFTNGIWASGEPVSGLWYIGMIGDNLSALGITANQLTRAFAAGGSVWWMPTTKEFGPQGAYGDWENHDRLATRFGVSAMRSRENRFSDQVSGDPDNTTIRLADSLNAFDTGSLAPGVTLQEVGYKLLSLDAGMKYHGMFLQTEVYNRWLDHFNADGSVPVSSIHDKGFYIQAAFYPVTKKLELYGATSQIYGDKSAGFRNSNEYLAGMNVYLAHSRNYRINAQVIEVNRSPVSSTFGYYVGGERGPILSTALSIFF